MKRFHRENKLRYCGPKKLKYDFSIFRSKMEKIKQGYWDLTAIQNGTFEFFSGRQSKCYLFLLFIKIETTHTDQS